MTSILLAVSITLMYSAPLVYSAMGGVITQRAGVDNIGIEGMMAFGAWRFPVGSRTMRLGSAGGLFRQSRRDPATSPLP